MNNRTRTQRALSVILSLAMLVAFLPMAMLSPSKVSAAPSPSVAGYADTVPVGRIAGDAGVDELGAATYSIPLEIPANRGGLLPPLSLTYNSAGGLGPYGEGWTLGGLSTIAWCHQARGSWGWCLDGAPLVPTGEEVSCEDSGDCPGNGWEVHTARRFRTHPDQGLRITMLEKRGSDLALNGTHGANDEFLETVEYGTFDWLLETPDGRRTEFYGCDELAACRASKISDLAGNYVELDLDDLDRFDREREQLGVEATIRFTGNKRLGLEPTREILIRPDAIVLPGRYYRISTKSYEPCPGAQSDQGHCLFEETGTGNGATTLEAIAMCEGHPDDEPLGTCLPPTRMSYERGNSELSETGAHPYIDVDLPQEPCHGPRFADFDGNGITDIFWTDACGEKDYVSEAHLYLAEYSEPGELVSGLFDVPKKSGVTVLDVDGDGSSDLVFNRLEDDWELEPDVEPALGSTIALSSFASVYPVVVELEVEAPETFVMSTAADITGDGIADLVECRADLPASEYLEPTEFHLVFYRGSASGGFSWTKESLLDPVTNDVVDPGCFLSATRIERGVSGAEVRVGWTDSATELVEVGEGSGNYVNVSVPRGGRVFARGGYTYYADDGVATDRERFMLVPAPPNVDGNTHELQIPLHDDTGVGFGGSLQVSGVGPCGPGPWGLEGGDNCPQYEFNPGWSTNGQIVRNFSVPELALFRAPDPVASVLETVVSAEVPGGFNIGAGYGVPDVFFSATDEDEDGIAEIPWAMRSSFFFDWDEDGYADLMVPRVFEDATLGAGGVSGEWTVFLWDKELEEGGDWGHSGGLHDAGGSGLSTGIPAWGWDELGRGGQAVAPVRIDDNPRPALAAVDADGSVRVYHRGYVATPSRALVAVEDGFGELTEFNYVPASWAVPDICPLLYNVTQEGEGPAVRCEVPETFVVDRISRLTDDNGDLQTKFEYRGAHRDISTGRFRGFRKILSFKDRAPGGANGSMLAEDFGILRVSERFWPDELGLQLELEPASLSSSLPPLPLYDLEVVLESGYGVSASSSTYTWLVDASSSRFFVAEEISKQYRAPPASSGAPPPLTSFANPSVATLEGVFPVEYTSITTSAGPDAYGNPGVISTTAGDPGETVTTTVTTKYSPFATGSLVEVFDGWANEGAEVGVWLPARIDHSSTVYADGETNTVDYVYYDQDAQALPCSELAGDDLTCFALADVSDLAARGALRTTTSEAGTDDELRSEVGYDEAGNIIVSRTTSPSEFGTERVYHQEFDWDERLFLTRTFNPLGHVQTVTWDTVLAVANVMSDATGIETHVRTDGLGRPVETAVTGMDGTLLESITTVSRHRMEPNANGLQDASPSRLRVRTSVAGGGWSETESGQAGLPTLQRAAADGPGGATVTRTLYSGLPRVAVSQSVPRFEGDPTDDVFYEYEHDALGRVWRVTDPLGRETTTHLGYRSSTVFVPGGTQARHVEYDSLARPEKVVDAAGTELCLKYDARSNVDLLRKGCDNPPDGAAVVDYEYDVLGRLRVFDEPASGRVDYSYDGFGQLETMVNGANEETSYRYDVLGRVVEEASGGIATEYFFDEVPSDVWVPPLASAQPAVPGALFGVRSQSLGHSSWSVFDEFGRAAVSLEAQDGSVYETLLEFDEYGRLATRFFPTVTEEKPVRTSYEYDALGQLELMSVGTGGSSMSPAWEPLERDAAGRVLRERTGAIEREREYDDLGRVRRQFAHVDGSMLQDYGLDYTDRGEVDYRISLLTAEMEDFGYDALGRLTSVDSTLDGFSSWSFDEWGNLEGAGAWAGPSDSSGKLIDTPGVQAVAYDDAGRLEHLETYGAGGRTLDLEYNDFGQPESIAASGYPDTLLEYGSGGGLIRRSIKGYWGTETTRFSAGYRGQYKNGELQSELLSLGGIGTVRFTPEGEHTLEFSLTDTLGSGERSVDEDGAFYGNDERTYDVWGTPRSAKWSYTDDPSQLGTFGNSNLGFTGHRAQTDGGLVDMGLRHYDPAMRRFMTPDPVVPDMLDSQSWNRYAYARGNPSTLTDPTGAAPACDAAYGGCGAGAPSAGVAGIAVMNAVGLTGAVIHQGVDVGRLGRGIRRVGRRVRRAFGGSNPPRPRPVPVQFAPLGADHKSYDQFVGTLGPSAPAGSGVRNVEAHGQPRLPPMNHFDWFRQQQAARKAADIATLGRMYDFWAHPVRPPMVPEGFEPVNGPNGVVVWKGSDRHYQIYNDGLDFGGGDTDVLVDNGGWIVGRKAHGLEQPDIDPYVVASLAGGVARGVATRAVYGLARLPLRSAGWRVPAGTGDLANTWAGARLRASLIGAQARTQLPRFKPLLGPGGVQGGWTLSRGAGYGSKARLDYHFLPAAGKGAKGLTRFARGRRWLHYHRRGPGGIGLHRPWQTKASWSWWQLWKRF